MKKRTRTNRLQFSNMMISVSRHSPFLRIKSEKSELGVLISDHRC